MNERRKVLELFEKNNDYMCERINSGIEQNRKGYAQILVIDKDKKAVSGAKVRIKQKTHEFKYGANLFMLDEFETQEKNELYRKYFSEASVSLIFGAFFTRSESLSILQSSILNGFFSRRFWQS